MLGLEAESVGLRDVFVASWSELSDPCRHDIATSVALSGVDRACLGTRSLLRECLKRLRECFDCVSSHLLRLRCI